jgi:hypothetical protein
MRHGSTGLIECAVVLNVGKAMRPDISLCALFTFAFLSFVETINWLVGEAGFAKHRSS